MNQTLDAPAIAEAAVAELSLAIGQLVRRLRTEANQGELDDDSGPRPLRIRETAIHGHHARRSGAGGAGAAPASPNRRPAGPVRAYRRGHRGATKAQCRQARMASGGNGEAGRGRTAEPDLG